MILCRFLRPTCHAGNIKTKINRPFARSGHMVRNKLNWYAIYTAGLSKQRKVWYVPAWSIAYHVTASWKGPAIVQHRKDKQRLAAVSYGAFTPTTFCGLPVRNKNNTFSKMMYSFFWPCYMYKEHEFFMTAWAQTTVDSDPVHTTADEFKKWVFE